MDNKEFGKIIKIGRVKKDMTQADLAREIGCSVAIVCEWERGNKAPSINNVFKIEEALGVKILTKEFMEKAGGSGATP